MLGLLVDLPGGLRSGLAQSPVVRSSLGRAFEISRRSGWFCAAALCAGVHPHSKTESPKLAPHSCPISIPRFSRKPPDHQSESLRLRTSISHPVFRFRPIVGPFDCSTARAIAQQSVLNFSTVRKFRHQGHLRRHHSSNDATRRPVNDEVALRLPGVSFALTRP